MPYRQKAKPQYAVQRRTKAAPKPKLVPQQYHSPVNPMLAQEGKRANIPEPKKQEQRKYDGTRVAVIKEGDKVRMVGSRSWKNDYGPLHPHIIEELKNLPVDLAILDGELTFFKVGTDRDVFVTALASPETRKRMGVESKLELFDVLYVEDDDLQHLPFKDRDEILRTLVPSGLDNVRVVKTVTKNKEKYFDDMKAKQGEGVVLKEEDSPYRQGVRSPEWLKVKHWKDTDVVVVGWTPGNGARASTFGALILAQKDKTGKLKYVGRTAGLKTAELATMLKKMKNLQTPKAPLADIPADVHAAGWVKPEMVITVKYYERTPNQILRFPDFLRERPDKKPSEAPIET